jgi:transcriptional regulator with XRE-family HTH domain
VNSLLDADLVRARRLELGLSERKLAALLGVSQTIVRGIEAGTNHKDLTLGDVQRLAGALSVEVHQLLTPADADAAAPAGPVTHTTHLDHAVTQLGALLYDIDRLLPVEALAATLGLTLDQTHEALDELDRRLRPAGLLVHRLNNTVKLWRTLDAVTRSTLQYTWRGHLARRGLDVGQAQLLHQVRTGRRVKTMRNDQQVTAAELTNAGIFTRTRSGGVELSPEVRYSLLLDEEPAPEETAT